MCKNLLYILASAGENFISKLESDTKLSVRRTYWRTSIAPINNIIVTRLIAMQAIHVYNDEDEHTNAFLVKNRWELIKEIFKKKERKHAFVKEKRKKARSRTSYRPRKKASLEIWLFSFTNSHLRCTQRAVFCLPAFFS